MDKKAQKHLVQRVVRVAKNTVDVGRQGHRRTYVKGHRGGAFGLIDEFADEYDDLVSYLLSQDDWVEKFSKKYVDKALRELFVTILSDERSAVSLSAKASEHLSVLVRKFESYREEHVCYVPLVGLHLSGGAVGFGPVVLKTLSGTELDNLVSTMESIVLSTKASEDVKTSQVASQKRLLESLDGVVCAEFRAVAEPQRARQRAEDETRRVLDLLRFAIPVLYAQELQVAVGFLGEVFNTNRITPTFSNDRFNVSVSRIGPRTELELSSTNLETMRNIGIFKVAEFLGKSKTQVANFEETLLRGIHWFADAQVQPEPEGKLLSLITCLETFLTPRKNDPIRATVAEGVAMIVADDVEARKRLRRIVLDLYDQRSGVSHGGHAAVSPVGLKRLQAIAHALTSILIQREKEFSDKKDLAAWLVEQRLS